MVYGEGGGQETDYTLQSIHYRLDPATGVAVATLNTPGSLNSLTQNQTWEYMLVLRHFERDPNAKVIIWTGHGRAFSSGADLKDQAGPMLARSAPEAAEHIKAHGFAPGAEAGDMALKCLTLEFWGMSKPSIVAVNGLAVGGAANIALANYHDIVLASTDARFMYPFANLGLTPELGSSYMMPLLVGMTRAKNMMMVGDWFSAQEALDMGLVLEVTPPPALMARAMEIATKLARKPNQEALRLGKRVLNTHLRSQMAGVMDIENQTIAEAAQSTARMMAAARTGAPKARL